MVARIIFVMLLVCTGALHSSVAAAVVNQQDWKSVTTFAVPLDSSSAWYVGLLSDSILGLSEKNDQSDIRIVNSASEEILYTLVKQATSTSVKAVENPFVTAHIVENTLLQYAGKEELAVVLDTGKEGQVYTGIDIEKTADSKNFRKIAHVYVADTLYGASSPAWREIEQKSVLYNYTDANNFTVENLHIKFSSVFSRYIKIQFESDGVLPENKIHVSNIQVQYDDADAVGTQLSQYVSGDFDFPEADTVDMPIEVAKTDEIIFKNTHTLTGLTLDVDPELTNFVGDVTVMVSGDQSVWKTVATGTVYRIASPIYTGEKLFIHLPVRVISPFVQVTVKSRDAHQIELLPTIHANLQETAVLFKVESGSIQDMRLLIGNAQASTTTFISKKTLSGEAKAEPTQVKLQKMQSTAALKDSGNSYIVETILLLIGILLLYLGYTKLRKS